MAVNGLTPSPEKSAKYMNLFTNGTFFRRKLQPFYRLQRLCRHGDGILDLCVLPKSEVELQRLICFCSASGYINHEMNKRICPHCPQDFTAPSSRASFSSEAGKTGYQSETRCARRHFFHGMDPCPQ